jgi:two pore calcium channel protein
MQEAINTMFVGGVTGDFIDCYLPSFVSYRPSGALWMVYLLLTQVLFKNLVMDTLITAYLNGYEKESTRNKKLTVKAMNFAFDLLSTDGETISRHVYTELVKTLALSPRWAPVPPRAAGLIYDQFGEITRENWVDVINIFQNELWLTQREGKVIDCLNRAPELQHMLKDNVWSVIEDEPPRFDKIMNKVLMVNLVLVFVESVYDYHDWEEPAWMDMIDIVFSFAYLGEVCVKLTVKSFGEYWSDGGNRFDFFTTFLLLFTSLIQYLPTEVLNIHIKLSHYANILRLLRLIRILKQLKSFKQVKFMLNTITRIVSEANEVLALMGTFFFFFYPCCQFVRWTSV